MFEVKKARRQRRPLKISLEGLSGSGKTYTALRLAFAMRRAGIGKRIVVADSENESAGLYDGVHIDGETWQYETCAIPHEKQNPAGYAECYEYLVSQGFDLIIFDSLSHAWHGAMEVVDEYARANRGDKFGGWAKVTPQQRTMLTTLTDLRAHCIVTMRVKSDYERTEVNGRAQIKKVGMKTDQRDNTEYEFDAVIRLDAGHEAHVEKVRGCSAMDNKSGTKPGPDFWKPLFDWWLSAEAVMSPEEEARKKFAAAKTVAELGAAWTKLAPEVQAKVVADKDRRKAELSPPMTAQHPETKEAVGTYTPVAEGEQRADPTSPPATSTSAPSAAPATASAATPSAPEPKPMPAAERRTDAKSAVPDDGIVKAGGAIIEVLIKLMHRLEVNWAMIRDGVDAGGEIADAAALPKMPVSFRINELSAEEALRLKAELEKRVKAKDERAQKRAVGKAAKAGAAS